MCYRYYICHIYIDGCLIIVIINYLFCIMRFVYLLVYLIIIYYSLFTFLLVIIFQFYNNLYSLLCLLIYHYIVIISLFIFYF